MSNKRRAISLETKLDIINRVEAGEKQSEVAQKTGLPYSTIATIVSQSKKIKTSVENCSDITVKKLTRTRSGIIEKMEKMLIVWIDDLGQRHMPVTQMAIQNKALDLFNFLKNRQQEEEIEEKFVASRGWFENFKKRCKIHSVRITGSETTEGTGRLGGGGGGTAAAAAGGRGDARTAKDVPEQLKMMVKIERGRDPPNILMKIDETGLFYKRLPSKTFISQEDRRAPGFKVVEAEDVEVLLDSYDDPLTNEELQDLIEQNLAQKDTNLNINNDDEVPTERVLTATILSDCLNEVSHSLEVLSEYDPDFKRSSTAKRKVLQALKCYSELLHDKKKLKKRKKKKKAKQPTPDSFLSKE